MTKWRESWLTFFFLLVIITSVAWNINICAWTKGLDVLYVTAALSVILGLLLSKSIFPALITHCFSFVYGTFTLGVLLPKMEGVFGKWDWVANGILFSFYHLHQPWGILANIPANLVFAYTGKRFRCNWFPIILHSGQSVIFLFLMLGLVLGLA